MQMIHLPLLIQYQQPLTVEKKRKEKKKKAVFMELFSFLTSQVAYRSCFARHGRSFNVFTAEVSLKVSKCPAS